MRDENERLPEALAKEVLARAAQLDASDRVSVSVGDLRVAAVEAGISSAALDRALNEVARADSAVEQPSTDTQPHKRRKSRALIVAVTAVVVLMTIMMLRMVVPSPIEYEPTEEIILPR